ncbi:DUF3299 domain-containing protein [Chitinimonas taiwanensis]|uniref:DUF3299 domain-containing protein n=1 Tax=Chitinimonas taiwanensis TaxID=240412 RepID=UPI0035AD7C6F
MKVRRMFSNPLLSLAILISSNLVSAADPSSLPPGPAPKNGAAFGVTPAGGPSLPERAGFVSWRLLAQIESVQQGQRMVPRFDKGISALHKKTVKLQGFMLPLSMTENQSHFILTASPPSCAFCLPGGPDSVIEVKASVPIKYGYEPITLSGKFEILQNDPMGLYYRITEAKPLS